MRSPTPISPPPSPRSARRNVPMSRTPSTSSKRQVRSGNRAMTHARLNLPMSEPVLLHRDGPVATLTLNRPDVLNALDFAMVEALVARTADVADDDTLRVVVLRG